jgi:hypothetical protein
VIREIFQAVFQHRTPALKFAPSSAANSASIETASALHIRYEVHTADHRIGVV